MSVDCSFNEDAESQASHPTCPVCARVDFDLSVTEATRRECCQAVLKRIIAG